jgi:hypothetical protein
MMAVLLVLIVALATLAFGAVYSWAFMPLYVAAALIGMAGLVRQGLPDHERPLALSLLLLSLVVALQLLPLPRFAVDAVSPHAAPLVSSYRIGFTDEERLPLSINPESTLTAAIGLAAFALYLLGLPPLLSGRTLRLVPPLLALFAVPLALYGMYTRSHNNGLIYGFWQPLDGNGANQAGPFINRNHFGGWMVMAGCLLLGWLFGQAERGVTERVRRSRRYLEWLSSAEANSLLMTGAAVLLIAISIFWSLSRSSILSLAAAVFLFGLLAWQRQRLEARPRTLGLLVLGTIIIAGAAWRGPELIYRFQDERNLVGRFDAWRDTLQIVRDFPLFGTGVNTYSEAMLFYQRGNAGWHLAQAHNDYLQILAEGGVMLAIPAAVAVALLVRSIRGNLQKATIEARGYWIRAGAAVGLCAMAVQEIFEFSLQIPANAFLFCTLAALALTPVTAVRRRSSRDTIPVEREAAGVALP